MLTFHFRVNDSFLSYQNHPLTVPRSEVDYAAVASEGIDQGVLTVIFPHGERREARLYGGEAGYGDYYQIRFQGADRQIPSYLELNTDLIVILMRFRGCNYAIMEFIK